jgi:hypothetical protein
MGKTLKLPPGIASYANLLEPRADQKGKLKFSVSILIAQTRTKELEELRKAALEVAIAKWGPTKGPNILANQKYPLIKDGNKKVDDEGKVDPAYKGMFVISMRSDRKPGIVMADAKTPIYDDSEVYSGCLVKVSGNVYAYEAEGNKGVTFGLNHVQVLKKLPRLDGRQEVTEAFEPYVDPDGDTGSAGEVDPMA